MVAVFLPGLQIVYGFVWRRGMGVSDWLNHIEAYSAPHFMRGFFVCLVAWIIGMKYRFALKSGWWTLICVLGISLLWEIRDQVYSLWGGSDPFDPVDILFDLFGWCGFWLAHLAGHRWEPK